MVVAAAAAVAMIVGLAAFLFYAAWPHHNIAHRPVPVATRTGFDDRTLQPTGKTASYAVRVTCLPVQHYLASNEEDPSCAAVDGRRARDSLIGLGLFAVAAIVWTANGADRPLRQARATGGSDSREVVRY